MVLHKPPSKTNSAPKHLLVENGGTRGDLSKGVAAVGELTFIDFEYGAYGDRGFDWGNHFNEWAGFDCDYTMYPSLM